MVLSRIPITDPAIKAFDSVGVSILAAKAVNSEFTFGPWRDLTLKEDHSTLWIDPRQLSDSLLEMKCMKCLTKDRNGNDVLKK